MRPKISRKRFNTVSDGTLLQLIGETRVLNDDKDLDDTQKSIIARRIDLCELLVRIDFTLESYGCVNFFVYYENEIPDLEVLAQLLAEFDEKEVIETIEKSLAFYHENKDRFVYLRNHPEDFHEKHDELQEEYHHLDAPKTGYVYSMPTHLSIERLAAYVRAHPDEFCVDEEGNSFKE